MQLTHFTDRGTAHMVDVGGKPVTARIAVAEGWITMTRATLALIEQGDHSKGDVLGVARIAGIMAAKQTANFVPLCHSLALTSVAIEFTICHVKSSVYCRATVTTSGQTGVEIEALCAVQISLLTVYDMCKAVERGMTITDVRLLEKSGGQSGHWQRPSP